MRTIALLLLFPCLLFADALPFLKEGAGARGEAMGGAGVASSTGADSTYWNPAAMLSLSAWKNSVSCSYVKLDFDRASGCFSAFERSEDLSSAFGVFWIGRYSGGIEERDATGALGAMFTAVSGAAGLSGALRLGPLRAGVSVKYYYSTLPGAGATGLGADLAFSAVLLGPALILGASVKDLSPGLYWSTGKVDSLPLSARAGLCFKAIPEKLEFTCDLESLDGLSVYAGAEYLLEDMLFLRSGLSKYGPSFGIGANCLNYSLDYSFLPDKNSFGPEHTFSLSFCY